jgi:hypothetical protein
MWQRRRLSSPAPAERIVLATQLEPAKLGPDWSVFVVCRRRYNFARQLLAHGCESRPAEGGGAKLGAHDRRACRRSLISKIIIIIIIRTSLERAEWMQFGAGKCRADGRCSKPGCWAVSGPVLAARIREHS